MKLNTERAVELAAVTASLSERQRQKTGCVLLDSKNRVISVGHNADKTHPLQNKYASKVGLPMKVNLHAEIAALTRLRGDLRPVTAVVVRLLHNGKKSMSKPCKICQAALLDSGVRQVYYTNHKGNIEEMY